MNYGIDDKVKKSSSFIIADGIDIGSLLLAYEQLHDAVGTAKTDLEKAGAIQYFEFTFELCWKMLKRILQARGKILNSPKPVFREAAAEGLIDDPEAWFGFIEDRNETVHNYDKNNANKIFSHLGDFDREAGKLVSMLKKMK